jgi:hypothetical protein
MDLRKQATVFLSLCCPFSNHVLADTIPFVQVAKDKKSFTLELSGKPFTPWGFNYDHDTEGRLIEDYWQKEWDKVEAHFGQMKKLGANVVRIHLQVGKFMNAADKPNEKALDRLAKLVSLAEKTDVYLDLTGLGCYRKADVPAWYDKLSEKDRWDVQARFWEAVAGRCAKSPAIFCYDLMNEPVVPGGRRKDGDWLGPAFAGKHFVQVITLDQADRRRPDIARQWVKHLVAAIRKQDRRHLITVGLVDWSLDRPGLTSGFVPDKIVDDLDFICVHIYPERGQVDDALKTLEGFAVGKPVVIEETFPLKCAVEDFGQFIDKSKKHAAGWIGFYWGKPPEELRKSKTIADAMTLGWLEYFQKVVDEATEPVTFEFKRKSGPAEGRREAFDGKLQTYYLHVHDIARFEIKAVAADLEKRMVVLKITGMLDKPEGPLTLYVPEKDGKSKEFKLYHQGFDKEFFRIERGNGLTTIEFLPAGKRLLRPGAWFQYVDFYRN